MKPLHIPIIHVAWLAALVAAFFVGRGTAPVSGEQEAVLRDSGSSGGSSAAPGSSGSKSEQRPASRPRTRIAEDPAAEILSIAELEDPIQRTRQLLALIDRLGRDEFEAVVAAFRNLGITPERRADYALLLTAWARVDPVAALAFLEKNSSPPSDRQTVLGAWALDNPDAAIEWAVGNFVTEGQGANTWLVKTIQELATKDLERATGLLNRLPQSTAHKDTRDVLNFMIGSLSRKDMDAAMKWVSALPDEGLRAGAARRISMRLASDDPQAVVRWAETLDPESRRQAFEELTQPWALRAPEEALAWASTLEGDSLHQIAERITPAAAAKDPQLAGEWLAQFNGDPAFDTARLRLVKQLSQESPEVAADWIGRITDVAMGEREFHRLLDGWMERDPEGLLRYMESNTVPESVRERGMRTLAGQEAPNQ